MGRGRSSLGQQIDRKLTGKFEDPTYGNKLLQAQGLDPFRLVDAAPMDDEVEPNSPTGITLTPYLSALSVKWNAPIRTDYVDKAIVEVTPTDTGVAEEHVVEDGLQTTISGLSYVDHDVRVKFVDLWERESEWSSVVTGLPNAGADYMIDLEEANFKGNLQGLIPSINLDLLEGENFAENTVRAVAMAQPFSPNLLPLIEVDFDAWPAGSGWPPNDQDVNGNYYITASAGPGNTLQIVDRAGIKWLQITRASGSSNGRVLPFDKWERRGVEAGVSYIASAHVQGNQGTRVRLIVEAAQDATGTGAQDAAATNVMTLSGDEAGERIFVKFTTSGSYEYVRIRVETTDTNTISRWTKFQLEQAGGKTEPSAWTPGVFSAGVLNARMLTAIDANIATGIFQEASIRNALIEDLTADKITAGTLSATAIDILSTLTILNGGKLVAGGTQLDHNGIIIGWDANAPEATITGDGINAGGTTLDSAGLVAKDSLGNTVTTIDDTGISGTAAGLSGGGASLGSSGLTGGNGAVVLDSAGMKVQDGGTQQLIMTRYGIQVGGTILNAAGIIAGGTLNTTTGVVTGGTRLNANGLVLPLNGTFDTETIAAPNKISDTTTNGRNSVAFFQTEPATGTKWTGIVLRAAGDATHEGQIALHATHDNTQHLDTKNYNAFVRLVSGADSSVPGQVQVGNDLYVERHINARSGGAIRVWDNGDWRNVYGIPLAQIQLTNGATATWTHGLSGTPRRVMIQYQDASGNWHVISEDYYTASSAYWLIQATTTSVIVKNQGGATYNFRGWAWY